MITFMRRYRKGLQIGLLVVIAAFVASLFVFGARGVGENRAPEAVARVNGESIPLQRYQRRYQAYLDAYSQVYRQRFTPELAEKVGLPQQVVNDLVQEAVVVQRARAEGLGITDEELNTQIQAIPAFQEAGRFSLKRYQEFLRQRHTSASDFEDDVRRELTRIKVENLVKSGAKVSDAEVEKAFASERETVRAAWALVELGPLVAAATTTDQEVQNYLKDHQAEFRQPDRRRVFYVVVSPKDFVKPVTEAEVEQYYQEHASEFESPRQVRASHVLVRVPETGGSEAEDKARAKASEVIRRVKAGEPFAKLARETSEDPGSAPSGGDLGFIGAGEVVPEFEKAMFQLKPGEISAEPVRSPFGYHVIVVTDLRPGGKKPLAAVGQQIRDRLSAQNPDRAAKARADEVRTALQSATDFMVEAKKLGLAPVDTKIARAEGDTGVVPRPESVDEAAFSLAIGGVGGPVRTPSGYIVLKAVEHVPAAVPPFTEIREQVIAAVKRKRAEAVALERAKQIAAEATTGDLVAAGKKAGATAGDTPPFSRAKPAERLPGDAMLAALETVTGAVTGPIKTPQGVYVLKVLERTPADLDELAKERDKITREVLARKQGQAWESWVASARVGARIEMSSKVASRRG